MELSGIAYQENQPFLCKEDLLAISDQNSDLQCFLRKEKNCLYITFRGTNSKKDRRTNIMFCKKVIPYGNPYSKVKVHSGFINAYKSPYVRNKIHSQISDKISEIKISGHSQGAALALLSGLDLSYNFPGKDYEVIVFGCPRVGNSAFKKSYEKRVFKTLRIENGNDIVTKIPLFIMGYRHVGTVFRIGVPRLPGVISFNDHRPQKYYMNIMYDLL